MDHADLEGLVVVAAQHVLHRGDVDGRVLLRTLLPARAYTPPAPSAPHVMQQILHTPLPVHSLLYEPLMRAASYLIQLDPRASLSLSPYLSPAALNLGG